MDMGFGDAPELKIPTIVPKKKRPVIESNDARVAEVNAKAGFSHPTEQAKRKRGRPAVSAKKPTTKTLPMIDGMPADYRRPADVNGCMTVHGPERVREAYSPSAFEPGSGSYQESR